MVLELLRRNASVSIALTSDGKTALMLSSVKGHLEVVRALLERGADINATDSMGATALTLSCAFGHLEVVRELCSKGADVDAPDFVFGGTPLCWLAKAAISTLSACS